MTLARHILLAAGAGLAAAGLTAVFAPDSVPEPEAATLLVAATGVAALAAGAAAAFDRFRGDADHLDLPPRGDQPAVAVPGDDAERRRRSAGWDDDDLRADLRETAVAALARYAGVERDEARDQLDRGDWTGDPDAAALFGDGRISTRDHVRSLLTGEPPVRRRARCAIDAVYALATGDEPSGDVDPEPTAADPAADWPAPDETGVRRTGRWRGARALALLAVGVGVVLARPGLLLAGAVWVAVAGYARVADAPAVELDARRSVSDPEPDPGDEVEVEVWLRNAGDATLPDLRLVDGVPPGLAVTDGSPRLATALRPGKAASFSYTVTAARGGHEFDPAFALARGFPGAGERAVRVEVDGDGAVTCVSEFAPATPPLRDAVTRVVGRGAAAPAAGGVEFHSLREYRPGDPVARVDWARLARTGDLATVAVREPRTASVVLAVDARAAAYVAPDPDSPPAAERCVEGAGAAAAALLDAGHRVGLVALSPRSCWVAPGSGTAHRARLRERLATSPAFARTPPGESSPADLADRLRRRLPDDAQVLAFAPLADDGGVELLQRVDAAGTPVAVVSPDPTSRDNPGRRLAAVERRLRTADLREAGVPVHDWPWDASFEHAAAGWSR